MSRIGRLLGRGDGARSVEPAPDLRHLVERVDALEALVEALQDSVDRRARRDDDRFMQLGRQLQPSELARALSQDARERGL